RAELHTEVELAEGIRFLGWELSALGLGASGERFDSGALRQSLTISRAGLPLVTERLILDDATRELFAAPAGLRGLPVSGVLLAGPLSPAMEEEPLQQAPRALAPQGSPQALHGLSRLGDFLVARYLGSCAWQAKAWFIA